jgi:hypothetical protein
MNIFSFLTSKSKLLLLIEEAKAFFNGLLNHLVNNAMVAAKGHEYMKVIDLSREFGMDIYNIIHDVVVLSISTFLLLLFICGTH